MKRFLLLMAFAVSVTVGAQNYPGEKVELLKDKQLKVLPVEQSLQKYGYKGFYSDEKLKKVYKEKDYATAYDKLVNKVFKVESFEPYKNSLGDTKYKLKLTNPDAGTLYFDYDTKYSHTFPFEVVGGLTFPEGYFCEMEAEKESATAGVRYYEFPVQDGFRISHYVAKSLNSISVKINTPLDVKLESGTLLRGVTLVLENGSKVEFPDAEVKVSPRTGGSLLTGMIVLVLSDAKVNLLKEHKITQIIQNKYPREFSEGFTVREYIKCLAK
jgi:hypothetical protein